MYIIWIWNDFLFMLLRSFTNYNQYIYYFKKENEGGKEREREREREREELTQC